MKPEDIQILTYTSGINCPATVKACHRPTGVVVEVTSMSRLQAEKEAMAALQSQVDELIGS